MKRSKKYVALATAGATAFSAVGIAWAQQETQSGKLFTVTVGQTLRYSDNLNLQTNGDSVLQSRTALDFAFDSVTRTQTLSFDLGGALVVDTDGDAGIEEPYARFAYAIEGANSRLSLDADYRRVDLNSAVSTQSVTDPNGTPVPVTDTARIEEGVRSNSAVVLRYETGLRSKVGFSLDLSQRARRYRDTTSANLFDTDTRRAGVEVTFRIDPQITARLLASHLRYEAEDSNNTRRRETKLGAGLTLDITPALRLDSNLQHSRVVRTSGGTKTLTDGLSLGLGLTQTLKNGTLSIDFSTDPTSSGRRSSLRANRVMDLRRDGRLSYGVGLTKTKGFSAEPLLSLSYAQPLKRGEVDLSFSQRARTDETSDEPVILTRLSARYRGDLTSRVNWSIGASINDVDAQSPTGEDRRAISFDTSLVGQISDVSSWSAGLTLRDTDTTDPGGVENQRRFGISLGYRHQMSRDWDLVASYRHDAITETGAADRKANTISLGLEKTFSFRP